MIWPGFRFRSQLMRECSAASRRKPHAGSTCISISITHRNPVIAAQRFGDEQEHHYAEHVGEGQHDEHVWIAEVLEGDDYAGRSITLRGAETTDILEMILSRAGKVTKAERR